MLPDKPGLQPQGRQRDSIRPEAGPGTDPSEANGFPIGLMLADSFIQTVTMWIDGTYAFQSFSGQIANFFECLRFGVDLLRSWVIFIIA